MFKPLVEIHQIRDALAAHFDAPVQDLSPIDVGQMARVFSFTVNGMNYVARFTTKRAAESIKKDRCIADRLASSIVPVPPIIHSGISGDLYYGIARRVPGAPLRAIHGEDNWSVVTSLIETLDAIHQEDVSDTTGYGMFDSEGEGTFQQWTDFLMDVALEGGNGSFIGAWHHLFEDTFLDRTFFDLIYERMIELLPFCPEERFLVHADYAFGNVMVKDGEVTAVLDWANAMYGDFIYDVAWMDLGSPEQDYRALFKAYYEGQERTIEHYEERLLCYENYVSLDAQIWHAVNSNLSDYEWMRVRTLNLIERGVTSA